MKTKETLEPRLFNKKLNSYAEWNGSAWEDKNISGAYFYSIEKANNNGWFEDISIICNDCGGNGKLSKGIINIHDIRTKDVSKEFETKLIDCIKCESCGHSWTPVISTREQAFDWWYNGVMDSTIGDTLIRKNDLCTKYYGINRHFNSLTGREIEEIWIKETQEKYEALPISDFAQVNKPNKKQFKQFDESLFKSYINKFSDEDKIRCFDYLTKLMLQSGFSKEQIKSSINFQ